MRKVVIKRSIEPDEKRTHVVWLNIETKHSSMWTTLFKGSFQDCRIFKGLYKEKMKRRKILS